jgi:hypothetical protein
MHGARAATTGTSETREESKWTNGKETVTTGFKKKDVSRTGKQNTPNTDYRQTTVPKSNWHGC